MVKRVSLLTLQIVLSVLGTVTNCGSIESIVGVSATTSSCSGVRTVCLEVRASNTAARALYEALDFQAVSVRKNYYNDPREDAVIMIKQIQKQEGI